MNSIHCFDICDQIWENQPFLQCTLLLHIICRYIHTLSKQTRWPGLLIHTAFCWPCKTLKSQYRQWGASGELQQDGMYPDCLLDISFIFCCGLLLVWWLVLHMAGARDASGYLFSNWIAVSTTHPHHPPTLISATPDITAMPVKASQNQAGQTINND